MKRNLLDLTQNILSALNSDEVNSISDTTESRQVAEIIRTTYYNLLVRAELASHRKLFQLTSSGDPTSPVLMYKPEESVVKLEWIKYYDSSTTDTTDSFDFIHDLNVDLEDNDSGGDLATSFKYVKILPIREFLDMTDMFNATESNVDTFEFTAQLTSSQVADTFSFNYRTDKQPQYCCILQNYYFIFDSYDSTQDDTLQTIKTRCLGIITPSFTLADDFIPDLDDWAFPLLLNEAKSLAFYELKSSSHPQAEREIHRQWTSLQKNRDIIERPSYFNNLPNFGRR